MNIEVLVLILQEAPAVTLNLVEAVLAILGLTTGAVAVLGMVSQRPSRSEMMAAIKTAIEPLQKDLTYIRERLDEHTDDHNS